MFPFGEACVEKCGTYKREDYPNEYWPSRCHFPTWFNRNRVGINDIKCRLIIENAENDVCYP
jgi:hypothetical protein